MFISNRKSSQTIHIQKQSHSGSADPFLPSHKQHFWGQKSMCPHFFSYHVIVLICLRHHSAHKLFTKHSHSLKNGNEGKKNKKLNVFYIILKSSLFSSDYEPHWQVTSVRPALTCFSIGFRLESGEKSTLNKTVRLKKILRGANHQKSWDKGIDYESITSESCFEQCMFLLIYIISLWEKSPLFPFTASNCS